MTYGSGYGYRGPEYERPRTQSHEELMRAQETLQRAKEVLEQAQREKAEAYELMSIALWCDPGDHAFSEKDPDKQQFERKFRDKKTGEQNTEVINVCGAHMEGIFEGALEPMNPVTRRTRALETDLGMRGRPRSVPVDDEDDL